VSNLPSFATLRAPDPVACDPALLPCWLRARDILDCAAADNPALSPDAMGAQLVLTLARMLDAEASAEKESARGAARTQIASFLHRLRPRSTVKTATQMRMEAEQLAQKRRTGADASDVVDFTAVLESARRARG
jgi:hypothetical protein